MFQWSRLTFDLSAKVAHIGVPSLYLNIVFSEFTWPIELEFHMKTPYAMLAKIYTKCCGHLTKMAATTICGKKNLKNLLLKNQNADDLGTWYVQLGMWALPNLHK